MDSSRTFTFSYPHYKCLMSLDTVSFNRRRFHYWYYYDYTWNKSNQPIITLLKKFETQLQILIQYKQRLVSYINTIRLSVEKRIAIIIIINLKFLFIVFSNYIPGKSLILRRYFSHFSYKSITLMSILIGSALQCWWANKRWRTPFQIVLHIAVHLQRIQDSTITMIFKHLKIHRNP